MKPNLVREALTLHNSVRVAQWSVAGNSKVICLNAATNGELGSRRHKALFSLVCITLPNLFPLYFL